MSCYRLVSGLALTAMLSGCAVGPDFASPAAPKVDAYVAGGLPAQTASADTLGGASQRLVPTQDIPGQWWTLFRSPALNDLVEQAIRANPDLQAAQASLRIAQENLQAQRGAYLPSVDLGMSSVRQKTSNTLSSDAASGASIYNLHTASVSVSYVVDVFGGTQRRVEAMAAEETGQRFQLEAAYLTLTSNVVAAAIQEASLRGQIQTTEELIRISRETQQLLRRRVELGDVAEAELVVQEASLAQIQQTLPPLKKALAQQRNLLTVLTGRFPSEEMAARFDLTALQLPGDLPVSLPSALVRQRPDIRAAEAGMQRASAEIGIATANMLPQITLSADIGGAATSIGQLLTAGSNFWGIAAGLSQPLFHGGSLLHQKRATEAAFDRAAAQYRSTVLTAFQNVADTLHAVQYDSESLREIHAAERAAARSLALARRQVELGNGNALLLLNSEQIYQQMRLNLVQAQASRFADTAALFQALGGGWWNREDSVAREVAAADMTTPR